MIDSPEDYQTPFVSNNILPGKDSLKNSVISNTPIKTNSGSSLNSTSKNIAIISNLPKETPPKKRNIWDDEDDDF